MRNHLIIEGPELSGKSFLLSQLYQQIESNNFTSKDFLDGCFWINSDIGVFGGKYGQEMVRKYIEIAQIIKDKPILFEKLHLTDIVYRQQFGMEPPDYSLEETKLTEMDFKIILTTFKEDPALICKRLADRLKLYPHYQRIAKEPSFYIKQQQLYKQIIKQTKLPYQEVELQDFSEQEIKKVLDWLRI